MKPFEISELLKILKLCIKTEIGSTDLNTDRLTLAPVLLNGFDLDQPLERLAGNWSSLKRLLKVFAEQLLPIQNQLESLLADDQLESLLHSLKGMSGDLGATRLYSISKDLNTKLKANQKPSALELLELRAALTEVIDSLQNQLH